MARAIWSGAVSFGLVNVPVKAYAAVHDHAVHFHQLDRKSGARIHYRKVAGEAGREVSDSDIELGYELDSGKYVVVDPDELDELRPSQTRTIDVSEFVELEAIDPIFYEHTYWLGPDGKAAEQPYRLLLAAMIERGRVGVGTVIIRNKQYLAAVRPFDRGLALSTMRFADEVVPASEVEALPARRTKPDRKQLALAAQIIDALAADWEPKRYHDTYTESLRDLIERHSKGEELVREERPEKTSSNVVDLMAALEASVAEARESGGKSRGGRSRRGSGSSGVRSRKSAARKRTSSSKTVGRGAGKRAEGAKAASRAKGKAASHGDRRSSAKRETRRSA